LTLSLIPMLGAQVFGLETPGAKLNYGVNKVRFPSPLPVGSRIRAHVKVVDVADVPAGKQVTFGWAIEIEGGSKPACVAETVVLLLP
jgi:acyl dehydratase